MDRFRRPNIIAIECDVFPSERGDMSEQLVADGFATGAQLVHGAAEINGVPEDHCGNGEVETGSSVSLIFEASSRPAR